MERTNSYALHQNSLIRSAIKMELERSRLLILISASGLLGEQPLVDRRMKVREIGYMSKLMYTTYKLEFKGSEISNGRYDTGKRERLL